jgi:hypothetical protein
MFLHHTVGYVFHFLGDRGNGKEGVSWKDMDRDDEGNELVRGLKQIFW